MTNKTIIYDQPLTEIIRVCLRLEQLFHEVDHELQDQSIFGTRSVITSIIHILQILDRPDLKAKLAKELTSLLSNLTRYNDSSTVDKTKYESITSSLKILSRNLIDSSGKIGQRLRDIELLNMLRLHLATPGGGGSYDNPLYHYWLQQPLEMKQATVHDWLKDFDQIRQSVFLLLDLVRSNGRLETKKANKGFHQELLDPNSNLRMVRILVDDIPAYPELSFGRHFLSIRFFVPDIYSKPQQYAKDLLFTIVYCNI